MKVGTKEEKTAATFFRILNTAINWFGFHKNWIGLSLNTEHFRLQ